MQVLKTVHGWVDLPASCLTKGNNAEELLLLLLAALHRMWPDWAAAKNVHLLQSHKVNAMKATKNCFVHYYNLAVDLCYDHVLLKYFMISHRALLCFRY